MSNPLVSIRMTLAKPSRAGGDPVARAAALAKPNAAMAKALSLGMQQLALRAQKERFTGQGPFPVAAKRLGVVSGRLRRDIHAEPVEMTATGYQGRIGAAVEYFGPHEVGFEGTVQVAAFERQRSHKPARGPYRTQKSGKLTVAAQTASIRTGHGVLLPISVRAHSRMLKIPARAPLRTAIEDHGATILSKAFDAGVKQFFKSI